MVGREQVAVIVTLVAETRFAPVPHVRIGLIDADSWDGGGPGTAGPDRLDGGTPTNASAGIDAGSPNTRIVTVPEGTDQVTLWWESEGRSDMVPGAVRRPLTGAFGHLDVEAGFDVETSYEAECFAGGVSLGRIVLGSVVLPWVGDENGCIVQQPMNPFLHAVVVNLEGSWPSLTWEAPGDLVRTQGAVFPSLVSAGPRQSAQDVSLDFGAPTREVSQRVRATLGTQAEPQLPVWLVRSHQGILPRRFYGHVKTLKETDLDIHGDDEWWSEFTAVVTEIARPAPGLQTAPLSYDDLDVSYPDYDARDAAYTSYDAMDTDWSLAGAAG